MACTDFVENQSDIEWWLHDVEKTIVYSTQSLKHAQLGEAFLLWALATSMYSRHWSSLHVKHALISWYSLWLSYVSLLGHLQVKTVSRPCYPLWSSTNLYICPLKYLSGGRQTNTSYLALKAESYSHASWNAEKRTLASVCCSSTGDGDKTGDVWDYTCYSIQSIVRFCC